MSKLCNNQCHEFTGLSDGRHKKLGTCALNIKDDGDLLDGMVYTGMICQTPYVREVYHSKSQYKRILTQKGFDIL